MPAPDSPWFLPAFVVLWIVICGTISLMGGWHNLSETFKSNESLDGERFRFRSASFGWKLFPVSYGGCLFATVGSNGFALSVLPPFRFMHPRLVIPWSAVERCEEVKSWFTNRVAVYVQGTRLVFAGALGAALFEAWTTERRA
jgi:hypothetical protein